MNMLVRFSVLIAVALISQACTKMAFSPGTNTLASSSTGTTGASGTITQTGTSTSTSTTTQGTICQAGQTMMTEPTKFVAIVDMSGSNVSGPYEDPGDATDPQKTFRYGTLNNFYQEYKNNAAIDWGFLVFSGLTARSLIGASPSQPAFSSSAAMGLALASFMNMMDSGDTPYKAAMAMVRAMIQQDMAASSVKYQYRIAFFTDGYPTDECTPGVDTCASSVEDANSVADVQSVVSLNPSAIQFSTVYYGLPDSVAAGRLQEMAQAGGGQFVDTSQNKSLNLDTIVSITSSCQ